MTGTGGLRAFKGRRGKDRSPRHSGSFLPIVMTYPTENSRQMSRATATDRRSIFHGANVILIEVNGPRKKNA
jgi:hypothetical protein